jgi:site-specific DNA recombinase
VPGISPRAGGMCPRRPKRRLLLINIMRCIFEENGSMSKYSNKCVIYARVSTIDKQEYQRQVDELKSLAVYKKLVVAEVFGEKISGTLKADTRPAFAKMMKYIEENNIHHILVSELSRLGRRMRDTIQIIQSLTDKEICVHVKEGTLTTLDENFEEDTFTSIIINILIGFANIEKDTFANRSKSGLRYSVKNGGSGSGIIKPYGYKKVGKKLVIDEEEAPIVKLIFEKYLQGFGSQQIANFLNDKNIKTKYNKIFKEDRVIKTRSGGFKKASGYLWRDATIINILGNSIYHGERKHKGEIFEIDPIIDSETYAKAEIIRKEKYNKKNNTRKYENIFKEKIKCPVCGNGYFLHKRSDNSDNAYKCLSKRLKEVKCGNVSINVDKLNNAVYLKLKNAFSFQAGIDNKLSTKSDSIKESLKIVEAENNQNNNELSRLKTRQKTLLTSYLDNQIDSHIFTELNSEIQNDIRKFESKIALKNKEIIQAESLLQSLATTKNRNFENVEIFKKYIKEYINFIRIHDVTSLVYSGELGSLFPVKNDVISLIEVQSDLIDSQVVFLLSRYSNNLVHLDLLDTEDLDKKLPYITNYSVSTVGSEVKI